MGKVVVCMLLVCAGQVLAGIPSAERDSLVALYNSTNGAAWTNHGGWTNTTSYTAGTDPCFPGRGWFGVICSGDGTVNPLHVQEIVLTNNNLTGAISGLSGLTDMVLFDVEMNHMTGPLPSLSGLTNLLYFEAGNNQMTGQIPNLSGLNNMTNFDVVNNNLSGAMPVPPRPSNLKTPCCGLCGNFLQSTGTTASDQQWDALSGTKSVGGVPGWLACQRVPLPSINPGGVVPAYSTATTVQPGSWISIYGSNLANGTYTWNGNFPTTLGGSSVTINGKAAYLWVASPGQINLQAPDDSAAGTVSVVVTTPAGAATSTVTLASLSPSFLVLGDGKHVTGIVLTPGLPGNSGAGYDVVGPSRPVAAGETLVLYGTGFGPTNPVVPSGAPFVGAAETLPTNPIQVTIGGIVVPPSNIKFSGIVGAGLYQINLLLPSGLGSGDKDIVAMVGGLQTQSTLLVTLK